MLSNIPPVALLLAFESVARRKSFALAASELHITASAVSHQIARLERLLGKRLLDRTTAGVALTTDGEHFLKRIAGALGALSDATKDLKEGAAKRLYVHASPSFASLWLMPRLGSFAKAYPDVSLFMSASPVHSDFSTGQSDIDIRYGLPRWPDLTVRPILSERVLPLASPELIKRLALSSPEQLPSCPLIQSTVSLVQWSDWLRAQKIAAEPERFSLRFDRAQLSLDAAAQGLGIALESATIATSYLQRGTLAPMFSAKLSIKVQAHFAVYPARHEKRPELMAFLQWMGKQAQSTRDPLKAAR
jgi:DNA-binding transcriptional LysR family regulator